MGQPPFFKHMERGVRCVYVRVRECRRVLVCICASISAVPEVHSTTQKSSLVTSDNIINSYITLAEITLSESPLLLRDCL